jgi:hypothetical protein
MRFSKSLVLICAAICGFGTASMRANAQQVPSVLYPPMPDSPSLGGPANEQPSNNDSLETPIYDCACGCGIFEVGTSSMFPTSTGATVYFEYDFQDQNINWSGSSRAPAADNDDKEIRTSFFTAGLQYFFNRNWGIQAELPLDYRYFDTTGGATGTEIVGNTWAALGDLRVEGIYTGFFPDQSAGVTFGFKLPTGDYTHNDAYDDIDRDSELGTGSTDVLLGGFYRNGIGDSFRWNWFAQLQSDLPFTGRDQYLPGCEVDGAVGIYYNGLVFHGVRISPLAQMLGSYRAQDSGNGASNPVASGYTRLLLSPGIEFDVHPWMFYLDAEFPVWQHFTGDQLTAPVLIKFIASMKI